MKIKHSILCDQAVYNEFTEKLDCRGIFPSVTSPKFPCHASFSIVFWLTNLSEVVAKYSILLRNQHGKVIGGKENPILRRFSQVEEALLIFDLVKLPFETEGVFFTVEIWYDGQKIASHKVRAIQALLPQPVNKLGDRGHVELY